MMSVILDVAVSVFRFCPFCSGSETHIAWQPSPSIMLWTFYIMIFHDNYHDSQLCSHMCIFPFLCLFLNYLNIIRVSDINISFKSLLNFSFVPIMLNNQYTHMKQCVDICRVPSNVHIKLNLFMFIICKTW